MNAVSSRLRRRWFVAVVPVCGVVAFAMIGRAFNAAPQSGRIPRTGSSSDITFVRNAGQWDDRVQFRASVPGAMIWLCHDEIVYQFIDASADMPGDHFMMAGALQSTVVHATFVNSGPRMLIEGNAILSQNTNFFTGNDPSRWSTNVPTYASVTYHNVYSGIDLEVWGRGGRLQGRWVVTSGADLSHVQLRYATDGDVQFDQRGAATVSMGGYSAYLAAPPSVNSENITLLNLHSRQTHVTSSFAAGLDEVQASSALTMVYSTYLGGSQTEVAYGVTVDRAGAMYICGYTLSANLPTQSAYDATYNGWLDAFVSKISPDGSTLEYSTYLGGNDEDWPFGLAVDTGGNVYVTGHTNSADYPLVNEYDATPNGGLDVFVAKLAPAGDSLVYSTYFGGNAEDNGWGIVVDSTGMAVITGFTLSDDMPTANPIDATFNGVADAFVAAFSPSGNTLVYSTYLGGTGREEAHAIAQGAGSIFIAGWTNSSDFQTFAPYDDSYNGGDADVFLVRLDPSGSALLYSTYFGGSDIDWAFALDVDSAGSAYISGPEWSADLPATAGAFDVDYNGGEDAFIARFTPDGDSLVFCTYVGGTGFDFSHALAVDRAGRICVTGHTESTDFPTVVPFDGTFNGAQDVFLTLLTPDGSDATFSTYVGGSQSEHVWAMWDDSLGNFYCTGMTGSDNFPTRDAYDNSFNGPPDAFLIKLSPCLCPNQGDLDANGFPESFDLNALISALFFNGSDPRDALCPYSRGDLDANGVIDSVDLNRMIEYLFFNGPAPVVTAFIP